MGFLDRIWGLFGSRGAAGHGNYRSLEVFLSGKIAPGSAKVVRDQILGLSSDEKMKKALQAYVKSGKYKNSPLVNDGLM